MKMKININRLSITFITILFYGFFIGILLLSLYSLIITFFENPETILEFIVIFVFLAIPIGIALFITSFLKNKDYIFEDKNIPDYDDIHYNREIPFDGNLFESYALLLRFNIIKRGQNLLAAVLLDWSQKGYIKFIMHEEKFINLKHSSFSIQFKDNLNFNTKIEQDLLNILLKASSKNQILEEGELSKYLYENPYALDVWFWNARLYGEQLLINDNIYIKKNKSHIIITKKANEKVIEFIGLYKFLLDYSMITDREVIEVTLWERYLIIAQLLDIADTVKEQLKNLNLDFGFYSDINISFSNILNFIKE